MQQLAAFQVMLNKGYIYRAKKPVYWSPSSRSALAEAELEYNEHHVSRSVYVRFPVCSFGNKISFTAPSHATKPWSFLVWTTTAWTLPANQAIAVNPALPYCFLRTASDYIIVLENRVEAMKKLQIVSSDDNEVLLVVLGSDLEGCQYNHAFISGKTSPVLSADYVTDDSGTGCVHQAPGHGLEDYYACVDKGLAVISPVDENGRFSSDVQPCVLQGCDVFTEGTAKVIELLTNAGTLAKEVAIVHKYPYDWRTNKPILLRY